MTIAHVFILLLSLVDDSIYGFQQLFNLKAKANSSLGQIQLYGEGQVVPTQHTFLLFCCFLPFIHHSPLHAQTGISSRRRPPPSASRVARTIGTYLSEMAKSAKGVLEKGVIVAVQQRRYCRHPRHLRASPYVKCMRHVQYECGTCHI